MSNLPQEIWIEILTACLPTDTFVRPTPTGAPLLLCQVCRTWRNIVIDTPWFWSSIAIRVSRTGVKPQLSLVDRWLARAKDHRLTLSLSLARRPGPDAYKNSDIALRSIIPHFHRWRKVDIHLGPFLSPSILLEIPTNRSSTLKSLSLFLPSYLSANLPPLSHIFTLSPDLSHLSLGNETADQTTLSAVQLPFSQLNKLHLDASCITMPQCLLILSQTSLLEDFRYYDLGGFIDFASVQFGVVSLPLLRNLVLSTISPRLGQFLDHLVLPSIQRLDIEGVYPLNSNHISSLMSRSQPSQCTITHLRLSLPITSSQLEECLRTSSTSLTSLTIDNAEGCITDDIVELLTLSPPYTKESIYCPNLTSLTVEADSLASTDGRFGDMILSRWLADNVSTLPGSQLEKVDIDLVLRLDDYTVDQVKLWQAWKEGLNVPSLQAR